MAKKTDPFLEEALALPPASECWFDELTEEQQEKLLLLREARREGTLKASYPTLSRYIDEKLGVKVNHRRLGEWMRRNE